MAVPLLFTDQQCTPSAPTDWRFPLDDAPRWSKAARTLAEHEETLLAGLASVHAQADATAALYETATLAAMLAHEGHPADVPDRETVVAAYRAMVADRTDIPETLAALQEAAAREQRLAERLNALLDDGEGADRHMRAILKQGFAMAEDLMRELEQLLPRQLAGAWAARVATAHVEHGADIAAAARAQLRPAAKALVHLVYADGQQRGVIAREAARAKGALAFCQAVMAALELEALPMRWTDL
ncbi:hypothetical protein AB0F17_34190 [Nonomuraea sp. NPDC026600]|uniref:hypothetical protein n=1 Tax=Nonomuraea sp. NPDC026600 TaxID=3155363 RepID=UPI0033DE8BFB